MFVIVYNYESKYVLYLKTVFFFQICTKTFVFGDYPDDCQRLLFQLLVLPGDKQLWGGDEGDEEEEGEDEVADGEEHLQRPVQADRAELG